MGTLRAFRYDDPNYTVVRTAQFQQVAGASLASTAAIAPFRSRVAVVVNAITVVCSSAASLAKVVFVANRAASANTTFTMSDCLTVGNLTTYAVDITLLSAGEALTITKSDTQGEFRFIYEYQVLPSESLYARA
jgi:hypothetical protein